MGGKRKRFNPDQVSEIKTRHGLQVLAPNSGNFRDPLLHKRGRKPSDHPWKGTPERWVTQGPYRVMLDQLGAILREAGEDGWDYQIVNYRASDSMNSWVDGGEVVVVFKKHFFKKEQQP